MKWKKRVLEVNNKYKLTNDDRFKNLPQQDRETHRGREVNSRFFLKVTFLFIIFFKPFVILYSCSTNIINKIAAAAAAAAGFFIFWMLKFFWALFSSCRGWWELISGQLNSSGSRWGRFHWNLNHLNHWNHRLSTSITAWFVFDHQYFPLLLYVSSNAAM